MTPTFSFEGIGTYWKIYLYALNRAQTERTERDFIDILKKFDSDFSRFKENSFISKLNREKKLEKFPLELFEMLDYCEKITYFTEGHFSATAGTALNKIGYDAKYSFIEKEGAYKTGFITKLTPELIEISAEASIDLGGIGKGWLIDKYAKYLKEHNVAHFLIDGGGDILATSQPDKSPFVVQLENPFDNSETIGQIVIKDAAAACSSPSRRQWKDKITGKGFHHLVDVKTGDPINEIAAVFTYGKSALQVDAASTAFYVSPAALYNRIKDFFNVEYMVISQKGTAFMSDAYPGLLLTED